MFNLAAFEAKMSQVAAALPALGQLIMAAQAVAPQAAGLTKAGLVINTAIAVEPALVGTEQILAAAVTGIVDAFRSAGTLPAPASANAAVAGGSMSEIGLYKLTAGATPDAAPVADKTAV